MKLLVESADSRTDTLTQWLTRVGVALFFIGYAGLSKLSSNPHSEWVALFTAIGWGQWFRYFTGGVQIAGGLLVLIPPTTTAGITVLACTMLGAMAVHVFVLHTPGFAVIPAVLFAALAAAGFSTRRR